MELTRNHYFVLGMLLLMFGLQFRAVESIVLTPEVTGFLAERSGNPIAAVPASQNFLFQSDRPLAVRKTVHPPDALGWVMLSVGGVLVLHSLALPKPAA